MTYSNAELKRRSAEHHNDDYEARQKREAETNRVEKALSHLRERVSNRPPSPNANAFLVGVPDNEL